MAWWFPDRPGFFLYIFSPQLYTILVIGLGVIAVTFGSWIDYRETRAVTDLVKILKEKRGTQDSQT